MDAKALLAERKQLFENAYDFKPNKRIPTAANFFTWKYLDAGYNLNTALRDYQIIEQVNRDFYELYRYDAYSDTGGRNSVRVSEALGGHFHYVNEAGDAVEADDRTLIEGDEFQEYMANPLAFQWSKQLQRYAKPGLTLQDINNAVMELLAYGQFMAKMEQVFVEEYGALMTLPMSSLVMSPIETLFNGFRGIKATALDIRKQKSELIEIMDFMWATSCAPALEVAKTLDDSHYVAPFATVLLAHSILSVSQFEELYWPYLKRIFDAAIETQRRVYIFSESTMLRFAEFFDYLPKGTLLLHPEQDDIFEVRRRLPNVALVGGMPTSLLYNGTPSQCVDYAKRLVDELGLGFVLSQDKMMSYIQDGKRENLLAVQEFAQGYSN